MSTATPISASAPKSLPRITPGVVMWAAIGIMTAYVAVHNEGFLVRPKDPLWEHYRSLGWIFAMHWPFSVAAFVAGPLQFSSTLRAKYRKWHRSAGYVYVVGTLVGAPLGAASQYIQHQPGWNHLAVADAILWGGSTAIAFYFAKQRDWDQHSKWMIRSYAVLLVFIYGRFFGGILGADQDPNALLSLIWVCLALAMMSGDLVITYQERQKKQAVKVRGTAA